MGKVFSAIEPSLAQWIARQHLFFVATAPLSADGLVNCSPKGRDTFKVLNDTQCAYLDLGGSGIETVAHAKENARICVMFCAFEGPPRIVRLQGRATVLEPGDAGFDALLDAFPPPPSPARSLIRIELTRISDSCGFGVPLYRFEGDRQSIEHYIADKSDDELRAYLLDNNAHSIDGLPGIKTS